MPTVLNQNAFRFRNDDGSESAATWKASENISIALLDATADFRLRFAISETGGTAQASLDLKLQYRKNSGAWTDVNTTSSVVKTVASASVANATATTNQIGGTGTFTAGQFDSNNGAAGIANLPANHHTEFEYMCQLLTADVAVGDVVDFRLVHTASGTALDAYAVTPTLSIETVSKVSQTRTLQYNMQARVSQTRTLLNGVGGTNPYQVSMYVGIAFGYDPYATSPVYTDMTNRFHSFDFERGRRTAYDTIDPARLTVTFHNQDRALDPSYAGSPYFPNVLPGVRIIVKIENETVYSGFIEGFPQDWDGRKNTVTLTALDLFDTFNVDMIPGTVYPIQKSGARITAGLSEIGVPSGWYAGVNTGIDDVQAHTAGREDNWLEHFKKTALTEQGYLFQDRTGLVKFYQRHALSISPFTDVQITLANDGMPGAWPFEDVVDPDFSVKDVKNDVRVTREGGATTRAFDATSITKYRKRTYQVTTIHDSTTVPGDLATWILQRDKDPKLRPDGVTMAPQGYPGMILPVIQRDLADRVRLKVQPPGPSGVIDLEAAIQSIKMSMGEDRKLIVQWNLAPPTGSSQVWKLGTHTLGVDTYLGF